LREIEKESDTIAPLDKIDECLPSVNNMKKLVVRFFFFLWIDIHFDVKTFTMVNHG
jgi:hypothetical protein